jgi:hypothetical protein
MKNPYCDTLDENGNHLIPIPKITKIKRKRPYNKSSKIECRIKIMTWTQYQEWKRSKL